MLLGSFGIMQPSTNWEERSWDIAIIGGGIAGLTAGIYAVRLGLKAIVFDRESFGGELHNIHIIENYPGYSRITGRELADLLINQARESGVELVPNTEVKSLTLNGEMFKLRVNDIELTVPTAVIATGVKRRRLGVPGEAELIGKGVSYCAVCDGLFFKGRPVAVIGGGNTAFSEALYLADIASEVHLIHRRDEFRAFDYLVKSLKSKPNVKFHLWKVVERINGKTKLESLTLRDRRTSELSELKVDAVFIAIGVEANLGFLQQDLVKLTEKGFIVTNEARMTETPGLFAAGDVRDTQLRQLVTAAADGAICAFSAKEYLLRKGGKI